MIAFEVFLFCLSLVASPVLGEDKDIPNVEPEELDMLLQTGQYEVFAKLMKIDDVSLVIPKEGARNEHPMFHEGLEHGDILYPKEQKEQGRQAINFTRYGGSKWQNRKIPYVISSNYNNNERETIRRAINRWNQQVGCLKLTERNGERDYAMVFSGQGCYSYLGRVGGQQPLSLQRDGCLHQGTVLHEFEHAAGFAHEHNRHDRNNYVDVLWDNIPEEWRSQYEETNPRDFDNLASYDFYSLMHYPYNAPGTRNPAFHIKRDGIDTRRLGNGNDFTNIDLEKLRILYC